MPDYTLCQYIADFYSSQANAAVKEQDGKKLPLLVAFIV